MSLTIIEHYALKGEVENNLRKFDFDLKGNMLPLNSSSIGFTTKGNIKLNRKNVLLQE